jgi:tetratricopeptide (TPR) repeat protein
MRKLCFLYALLVLTALPAAAQIGKRIAIQAGTPEDKALQEISAAADTAKKLELLEKFVADFGATDAVLAAYEMYIPLYQAEKNYAKVYESADKALAYDPENFSIAFSALRAAQEANDAAKVYHYGELLGGIVSRYKASPAPEGMEAEAWESRKRIVLAEVQDNLAYAEYTLFSLGASSADPARKGEMLERFVLAFSESQFAFAAATVAADAYRQSRQGPRMIAFAERVLARNPQHYGLLVQLADYWVDNREQFDKAMQYATKALAALASATAPPHLSPEQWTQQKNLQMGLAHYAIGQAHLNANRDADAAVAFKSSAPLLKSVPFYYARCLYFWGFGLARQKKTAEARPLLQEAASLDTPYKSHAQDMMAKLPPAKAAKKRG